jgi:NADH-quinone oxidoreductase subunit J
MTITPQVIVFAVMAIFSLGGGLGVVISRNLIHAAFYLVLSLFGIAGLFILLEASFLAAVQILVYVGAISVLITITIMVTRRVMGITDSVNRQWLFALIAGAVILATLGFILLNTFGGVEAAGEVPAESIRQLGVAFVDPQAYMLPFEVASVMLLAALIGAIVVARD